MPKKTIKDKVLLALAELNKKVVPLDVTQYLRGKEVSFSETKKGLCGQVCDTLWHLWKDGCIKKDGDYYYHNDFKEDNEEESSDNNSSSFHERDLHPLLIAYLERRGIFSKTIYHERSSQGDKGQTIAKPLVSGRVSRAIVQEHYRNLIQTLTADY